MRRLGRIAKKVGIAVLLLLAVAVGAVELGVALLFTDAGSAALARFAVPRLNAALPGSVEVGSARLEPGVLVLNDLVLQDPDGKVVATAPRGTVDFYVPTALDPRLLHFEEIRLVHPVFHLSRGGPEGRLNLVRALKHPNTPPSQVRVWADDVEVVGARIVYDAPAGRIVLEDVDLSGRVRRQPPEGLLLLAVRGQGRMTGPQDGPLALQGQLAEVGPTTTTALDLHAAGTRARLRARFAPGYDHARVPELRIAPPLVAVFRPGLTPAGPLTLAGTVERTGHQARADLTLHAGPGVARVEGAVDWETLSTPGLTVTVHDLDLADLVPGAVETSLDLALHAEGRGRPLSALDGDLRLEISAASVAGHTLGPVRVRASAKDGVLQVPVLTADLPGLHLEGAGGGPVDDVSFQANLELDRLARARAVLADLGLTVPQVEGHGTATLSVTGRLLDPAVRLEADLPRLAVQGKVLRGLRLDARVPGIRAPTHVDADLEARSVALGKETLAGLAAQVRNRGREVSAEASLDAPQRLALTLEGRWDPDRRGLGVTGLTVGYPAASWSQQGPMHLSFGKGGLAVTGLELASGDGARLAATVSTAPLDGKVTFDRLRVRDLPGRVRPATLRLGGVVSGEITLSGRLAAPGARLRLHLAHGRVGAVTGFEIWTTVVYEDGHADGQLLAHAFSGTVEGRYAGPVAFPLPPDAPVDVSVDAEGLRLSPILATARPFLPGRLEGRIESAQGALTASADVHGPAGDPAVRGRLALTGGRVKLEGIEPYRDVHLQAHGDSQRVVLEALGARTGRGRLSATGEAARRGGGGPFELAFQAEARMFPIPGGQPTWATFQARLDGTLSSEEADGRLTFEKLKLFEPAPPKEAGPEVSRR